MWKNTFVCFHHILNWPIRIKFPKPMSDHLVWQLLKTQSWRTVKLNTILQCILYLKILQKKILYPFPCRRSINILQKIKYEDFFTIIRRIKIAPKEYSCHQLIFYCLIITCTTLIKYKSLFVNSQFGDMIETTLSKQKKKNRLWMWLSVAKKIVVTVYW